MFNETQQISLTIDTCMVAVYSIWLGVHHCLFGHYLQNSARLHQNPPESTRLHQNLPESAGVRQTPLDFTRLHQILPESARVWWSPVCHILSYFVTNLLLYVTHAGVCQSVPDSMEFAGVWWSMWGSVKYCASRTLVFLEPPALLHQ